MVSRTSGGERIHQGWAEGAQSARGHRAVAGFTLIEMLASVVILVLIVLAMGRIYASSSRAYQDTIKQAERDAAARAVMDFLAREISQALFEAAAYNTNALLSMRYEANTTPDVFGLEGADEIWLISANNVTGSGRPPRESVMRCYFVENYEGLTDAPPNAPYRFALWQNYRNITNTGAAFPYAGGSGGLDWMDGTTVLQKRRDHLLLENVRTFEIFAYADERGTRVFDWDSRDTQPLFCMDIYLETLSEADAIRAAQLAATVGPNHPTTVQFVESAVRRHYQRIFFPNKFGYFDHAYP